MVIKRFFNFEIKDDAIHLFKNCKHLYRNNTIPGWDIGCGTVDMEFVKEHVPHRLCKDCMKKLA